MSRVWPVTWWFTAHENSAVLQTAFGCFFWIQRGIRGSYRYSNLLPHSKAAEPGRRQVQRGEAL